MAAGTIALANNSNTITGKGTSFTSEVKAGDFIGVIVGSAPYTLVVQSVISDSALTIGATYTGPTTGGLAWYAVPASLQVAITQKILDDVGRMTRGMIQEKVNWQKIYSNDPSVTVNLPDLSQFTGPSWGYMAAQYASKLDKANNLSDVASVTTARSNLGLGATAVENTIPINKGGTASTTAAAARSALSLGYSNSPAGSGGEYRLFINNDSGLLIITRRFNVIAVGNSSTAFSYNWSTDGAGSFVGYPGCSVIGQGGNSADFKVGVEGLTSFGVSGFIHNTRSSNISVWLDFIVIGIKA